MIHAPIKALAPWFGAKRSLAADILPHFGPHDSYLAPDRSSVLIYADPPYIRKSCDYEHDFAGIHEHEGDSIFGRDERLTHERLAKLLNRFEQTRVVLSYYEEPELAEFYPAHRWRKVQLTGKKAMANTSGGGEVVSPEILLVNDAKGAA